MITIYVDADACPVKDEVLRVAARHRLAVVFVSNSFVRTGDDPLVRSVVVEQGPDVADDWIAEHTAGNDIVITNDVPLAARAVARGARVLTPVGKELDENAIGMAVAMRDLMTQLRETGEITGGPRSFAKRDRSRFLDALERVVQAALRKRD